MSSLNDANELASCVARERRAAAMAKCDKSRQAHLALAEHYQQKLSLADAVTTSIRISMG